MCFVSSFVVSCEFFIFVITLKNYGRCLRMGSLFVKVRWLALFAWFMAFARLLFTLLACFEIWRCRMIEILHCCIHSRFFVLVISWIACILVVSVACHLWFALLHA